MAACEVAVRDAATDRPREEVTQTPVVDHLEVMCKRGGAVRALVVACPVVHRGATAESYAS